MRKLVLILMAAFMVMAAASCTKDNGGNDNANDGIFNPSKKIHKVYYQDSTIETKEMCELWSWNGSKLESIKVGYGSSVYWTEYFTYEDNILVRTNDDDYEYADFTYRDGRLYKISVYIGSELAADYTYIYGADNKVSEISVVFYYDEEEEKSFEKHLNPLRLFLPEEICDRVDENRHRHASKGRGTMDTETGTISLTWSGDNIGRVYYDLKYEFEENGCSYVENTTLEITLQYDTKRNPRKGLHSLIDSEGLSGNVAIFYGKNNVKDYCYTLYDAEYANGVLNPQSYSENGEYHCSFEYDRDDYPVTIHRTVIDKFGNNKTDAYFYEYL